MQLSQEHQHSLHHHILSNTLNTCAELMIRSLIMQSTLALELDHKPYPVAVNK